MAKLNFETVQEHAKKNNMRVVGVQSFFLVGLDIDSHNKAPRHHMSLAEIDGYLTGLESAQKSNVSDVCE